MPAFCLYPNSTASHVGNWPYSLLLINTNGPWWLLKRITLHIRKWVIWWKQTKCASTDEWIKMWCMYTMEYSSAIKKEWNNAICNNMDGPRDYHTKWSKSERERQISYDITYMWNLEKWYKETYLQNRNTLTDIENKLMGGGNEEELRRRSIRTCSHSLLREHQNHN